jgi:outer membrane murein-binding lipoprotein Lpp
VNGIKRLILRGKISMKKIVAFIVVLCICVSLVGCASEEEMLNKNIVKLEDRVSELKSEISNLETERNALLNEVTDIKVENGTAKYIITFNIKQSHFTLDIGQHLKDEMNDISIQIPVDKEYYDNVKVGDTIADNFRIGSLIFKGSFGNRDITVEDKCIQ